MEANIGNIRTFETANFRVTVDAFEDYDVDLSFDDTGEVRRKLETGEYVCFTVHAEVIHKPTGTSLGEDYLGGCIYADIAEFQDHRGANGRWGSYFKDMIGEAIAEARKQVATLGNIKLRVA